MPIVDWITVLVFGCYRCGHSWQAQGPNVRICPRCKSSRWKKPRIERRKRSPNGMGPDKVLGPRRKAVLATLQKYRVENVRIFGSVARVEATSSSDLDLLVRFQVPPSLFD